MMKKLFEKSGIGAADIFAAFCAAFFFSSFVFALSGDFTDLNYVRGESVFPFIIIVVAVFSGTVIISAVKKCKALIAWALLIFFLGFALVLVACDSGNIYFNIGIAAVALFCVKYAYDKIGFGKIRLSKKASFIVTVIFFLIYVAVVYFLTAVKYKTYSHGTFDFGIFCQMFEQMAKTGLPTTTVERSVSLSHFAVHFSPIYYLLLPGYFLWRSPLYLLAAQAFFTGFGVFPLRRICRELGFSEKLTLAASAMFLIFPTISNGTFYDFHENKFLTVLILYAVYFVLKKQKTGIIVFSFLILFVKEDAFIYVLAIALWMIVSDRERILGVILIAFSVLYFLFACQMIRWCGGEIMSSRFENLYSGKGGLFDVIKTCFLDAGYVLREIFSGADTETFSEISYSGQKLEFVWWTAIPLLFLPFANKKASNLVLLIPLAVINLVPSWLYQYNVDYQYTYGTVALMIFASLLTLSYMPREKQKFFIITMLMICAVFTVSLVGPKAQRYLQKYENNKEMYIQTDKALEVIPEDASVSAYGYIMPHLWYIDDLRAFPEYYEKPVKSDYYVIDLRYKSDEHTGKMYKAMGDDYEIVKESGYVCIYKLKGVK